MEFEHPLGSYHDFVKTIQVYLKKDLNLDQYGIDSEWLGWFFTILIGSIAMFATIKTANYMSIGICGLALIFMLFGWYIISGGILALGALVAFLSLLKKGEKEMSQ